MSDIEQSWESSHQILLKWCWQTALAALTGLQMYNKCYTPCHLSVVSTTEYYNVMYCDDDVRQKTEQPHFSATIQARRLSLFDHTAQMPDESDAKHILTASPLKKWRRPPGRPHTTWMKTTQQDLESLNLSPNEATDVAQNCPPWRMTLDTYSGACQKWMNVQQMLHTPHSSSFNNKISIIIIIVYYARSSTE